MNDMLRKYLYDIMKSMDALTLHLQGVDGIKAYSENLTVKRAVERELEIIGEAMNNLLAAQPDIPISDSRKIIAMRNRIIHGYDTVDDVVVWNVLVRNIPVLHKEVNALLGAD